jgi:hypothetical protein
MDSDKFWKAVERFKLVIELIASLIVAVPIVYAILVQGFNAAIPVWAVLIISVFAIALGFLLGRNSIRRVLMPSQASIAPNKLLQKIDFNYKDSPTKHNWIIRSPDENQPIITLHTNGFWGKTIKIQSNVLYAMDLPLTEPIAKIGKRIEFIGRMENDSRFYSLGNYISKDGSSRKDIWFNYQIGDGDPIVFNDDKSEWLVYIEPELLEDNWQKFSIDLQHVINRSVAKEGWSLKELTRFRVRGNIQIAQIKVFR